jgi:type I restriction enzyme M protein
MARNGVKAKTNGNGKSLSTQQSVNQTVKSICDILRRSNCKGAMQYVPELTWILFLRILDEREQKEAEEAQMFGRTFTPSIAEPYRWHDWAATPEDSFFTERDGKPQGWKRRELEEGKINGFIAWVNSELLPYLHDLEKQPNATPRQKVISEVMSSVKQVRVDTDKNFLDVLDKVHLIRESAMDTTHLFPLSQVFEGLLLKMGEKGNDGGQFFTPREVIRAMVKVVDPKIGDTVYDAACGTGGFLAQAYEYMLGENGSKIRQPSDFDTLKLSTFYGREQDDITYTIALANLVLHQIDRPHIWHGNALTGDATYDGLYTNAPDKFDVVLMNPPFGGKEGAAAQINFEYKTGATQVLFLQLAMKQLKDGGRCGIVLDECVLFRTNEQAFVKTKRKLLDECDLYCIVSLPGGAFSAAGAGVKTNLLFFNKGKRTEKIWYYDLSDIKIGKKSPLTLDKFDDFFRLLPERGDSERSWTIDFAARREKARQDSEPFKQKARELENEAYKEKERLKQLKLKLPLDKDAISELQTKIAELDSQTRENRNKAETIENAIYDIKAVNPNTKDTTDKRTPAELLEFIAGKSKEVQIALDRLKAIS